MKPITAQDYAKCYGTFIANINEAEKSIPGLIRWFSTNFNEIYTIYLLNKTIFDSYSATVQNIGTPIKYQSNWSRSPFQKQYIIYSKGLLGLSSNLRISLKSAMSIAEVIPSVARKSDMSFNAILLNQIKRHPVSK